MNLTVEMVASVGGTLVALAAFAWGIVTWVVAQLRDRDLQLQAESARAKMAEDTLFRSLAEHKLYAAEHYATMGDLSTALSEVKSAIDRLGDRLDRLLENR